MEASLQVLRERVIAANSERKPLRIRGAGTKDFYGERLEGDVLDVRGHRGIVEHEPSELVITVRCGALLSEIEAALAEQGQFLPFEPPALGGADPTMGGVIAAGLSGPRRMQAGAARDFVLGATLMSAEGELLHFGGRVMKNVAGYDVSRLLCGSLGVLGLITELSIKVLPLPRAEQTLRFEMAARDAVEAFNRWGREPLPISAAAWFNGTAWVRLSGAASALRSACEQLGGEHVDAAEGTAWWDGLRHQQHAFFTNDEMWRVSVPSTAPPLACATEPLIEWGGALRWYAGASQNIRELAAHAGGTALHWRGQPNGSRFHPVSAVVAGIHRRLKQRFDPRGIFNPGRLISDL